MAHEETVVVSGNAASFVQKIQTGNHHLICDEPVELGGTDTGPNPYDFLLAGLGSCTSMTVSMYARAKNWPLQSVKVQLRHFKVESQAGVKSSAVDQIERNITLIGELSAEQQQRLLEIANKCPVHKTLTSKIEITSKLI